MVKRIFWSIYLRPVYSLLVILLFFVLGSLILLGFAWNSAAEEKMQTTRDKWGLKAVVQVNAKKLFEAQARDKSIIPHTHQNPNEESERFLPSQVASLTLAQADEVSNISEVKSAQYVSTINVVGGNIFPIIPIGSKKTSIKTIKGILEPQFQLVAVLKTEVLDEFKSMDNILISGSDISPADLNTNNAIIESEVAANNHLKIGDTFKLGSLDGKSYDQFKVSGIFVSRNEKNKGLSGKLSFLSEKNKIFVPITALSKLNNKVDGDTVIDKAIYTLNDPNSFEKFRYKALQKGIKFSIYDIYADDSQFNEISSKIKGAISTSLKTTSFLLLTIFISTIVILKVTMNKRIKEIQYLLFLGESNRKIFTQFLFESMFLIILGFLLSIALSSITVENINHFIAVISTDLKVNVSQSFTRTGKYFVDISKQTVQGKDYIFTLHLGTKLLDEIKIIFIGIFICTNAAIGALWKVLRLSKRNLIVGIDMVNSK